MFKLEGDGDLIIGSIFLSEVEGGRGYKWQFTVYHRHVETVWMAKNVCCSLEWYSPIKVTGVLVRNFENTPERYQNLVLWACPKFISTPKRY